MGNERVLVVSNQSGKSNVINKLKKFKINVKGKEKLITKFLELIKHQEFLGYAYDGAEASFELLAKRKFSKFKEFYSLESFKVSDEKEKIVKENFYHFQKLVLKL